MTAQRRWLVGRLPDCDVVVPVPEVSSRHCELVRGPAGFTLADLGSANGTFVNGARVGRQPVPVTPTDVITLGAKTPFPWPKEALAAPSQTVAARVVTIGRRTDNDVVLDYPMVSGRHARVIVTTAGAEIEDLDSRNGIAINDPANRVKRAPLVPTDTVYLGSLRVPAARLMGPTSASVATTIRRVPVEGRDIVFGRRADCDQVLDYPMVSGRHARLQRKNDGLVLEDLGSANGTYVNGNRVAGPTAVKPGDQIGLGTFTFTLTSDAGELEGKDERGSASLEARNVTFRAGSRTLIEGISFTAFGGEFVGLMGPSGAGKTTLMNTLNGYTPPTAGHVLINGHELYRHYDQFRHCLGYVPQEDVMHRDLTVGQALFYSARLRLPRDYTAADIRQRVTAVLDQLGLTGTEDVLIGSAEKKGISGGQRKRVNLAMELLTDPLILFLDEPTSGLSSEDALLVMKVLKGLADQGKVIVLTIHQPSLDIFTMLDHLLVVAKDPKTTNPGVLTYFGPAHPDSIAFFNPEGRPGPDTSPDEVLRGLKKKPSAEWADHFSRSGYWKRYVEDRAGTETREQPPPVAPARSPVETLTQWQTLTVRALRRKLADQIGTAVLLAQAPAFAVLLVMVFGKSLSEEVTDANWTEKVGSVGRVLFQLVLSALWFGCSNSIREIVGEWAVYRRERMVNLRLIPYIGSKFAVLGGLCVLQCFILLGVVHLGCELKGNIVLMFFLMLLASLVGVAIGLVLSAAAKTNEIAIGMLPLVLLTMVALGGGMQPLHKMPKLMEWTAQTMPSRWAFEEALLLEVKDRPTFTPPVLPGEPTPKAQDMAEPLFPEESRTSVLAAFVALALMLYLLAGSVLVILRMRDVH